MRSQGEPSGLVAAQRGISDRPPPGRPSVGPNPATSIPLSRTRRAYSSSSSTTLPEVIAGQIEDLALGLDLSGPAQLLVLSEDPDDLPLAPLEFGHQLRRQCPGRRVVQPVHRPAAPQAHAMLGDP